MSKGLFLVDSNNNVFGRANLTRWNNAKWYQKLIGFFFKSYKAKFIDVKPFKFEFKTQLTQEQFDEIKNNYHDTI